MRAFVRVVLRIVWSLAAWLAVPVLFAGLAVRLTIRDDVDAVAVLFYATPWAVLWVLALICTLYWRRTRAVRWSALLVCTGCFAMWIAKDFGFASGNRTDAAGSFRVAYWNVARPEWRLDAVLAQSRRLGADYFVFGEHRPAGRTPARWQESFNGQVVLPLARELLFVAPEAVKRIDGGSLGGAGGCQLCRTVIGGREVFMLLVDFTATLHKSRRPGFDRLFQIVDAYAEKPLLVIGDFNTPSDSAHFDRLRTRLTGAFETAGTGYAPTWPMPLPVLQLDHIWTNKHLRVIRCEHVTSFYSDHRAVVADVAFP